MAESSNISVTGIGPVKPEQAAPLFLMRDPVIFPYSLTPLLVERGESGGPAADDGARPAPRHLPGASG